MVLYILFDSVLGCHSVQAMVAQLCQEGSQCHSQSIELLFPLIRCLKIECDAGVYASQQLKPKKKKLLVNFSCFSCFSFTQTTKYVLEFCIILLGIYSTALLLFFL